MARGYEEDLLGKMRFAVKDSQERAQKNWDDIAKKAIAANQPNQAQVEEKKIAEGKWVKKVGGPS